MRLVTLTSQPDFRADPLRAALRRILWRLHWKVYPHQPVVVRDWWRGMEILLPKSGSAAQIFYRTLSSAGIVDALKDLVRDGMVVIDVGAHVGEYTLIAAKLLGETGAVHAFEPQPMLAALIERNAAQNHLTNIRTHPCAVSDRVGRTRFRSDPQSMGGWMTADADGAIDVPCTTLDQFAIRNDLTRIHLMKIDAGGNELAVLRGSATVLATHGPAVICKLYHPEVAAARFGYDIRTVAEILWDTGYAISVLDREVKTGRAPVSSWGDIRNMFNGGAYCLSLLSVKRASVGDHPDGRRSKTATPPAAVVG